MNDERITQVSTVSTKALLAILICTHRGRCENGDNIAIGHAQKHDDNANPNRKEGKKDKKEKMRKEKEEKGTVS